MQTVTIRELDERWRSGGLQRQTVLLDLSDAAFIAHDVLLYIVGVFQHRASQ